MEADVTVKAVRQMAEDDYGEGFIIVDIGGVAWGIKGCPSCPAGVELATDMDDDVLQNAFENA